MGKFTDLTGQKFGRLTVIERAQSIRRNNGKLRTMWRCKCECGNECIVAADAITRGAQVSCGCYRMGHLKQVNVTHGMTNTRLYYVWCGMKNRCCNENTRTYPLYGGRGIKMCDEWRSDFMSFYNWAVNHGYDENAVRGECTINRIDCDGNYCPENCRIVSQLIQMNNVRTNHNIIYNGETHSFAEWSRITGISQYKIRNRIVELGWTPERTLTTI